MQRWKWNQELLQPMSKLILYIILSVTYQSQDEINIALKITWNAKSIKEL